MSLSNRFTPRAFAALTSLGTAALVLAESPAQAHGFAHGGLSSGFLHPITGPDHLLLLIAVGAAASYLSAQLLLWALAGAVLGGVFGALGGSLPYGEVLAALAISAVAVLILRSQRSGTTPKLELCGKVIASAVAVHAMLHGHESPTDATALSWWLGALTGSVLVSGSSFLVLRRLPLHWTAKLAVLLALVGGVVALGPLGLLVR